MYVREHEVNLTFINSHHMQWKIASCLLQIYNFVLVPAPLIVVSVVLWVNLDPFSYTFPKFMTKNSFLAGSSPYLVQLVWVFEILLRIVLSHVAGIEACRFYVFYCSLIIHIFETTFKVTAMLNCVALSSTTSNNAEGFMLLYQMYEIAGNCLTLALQHIIGIILGDGFFIFILLNLGTLKCFHLLPIFVYFALLLGSIICTCALFMLLRAVIEIYTTDFDAIKSMRMALMQISFVNNKLQKRVLVRQLSTLKPLGFSCSLFYPITRGSELEYFFYVCLRTVDLLLLNIV